MPILRIEGQWYGGGCSVFSGEYDNLGNQAHSNFSIVDTAPNGACGGYRFSVRNNISNTIIYNSTSNAQNVYLTFDGIQPEERYDCLNGVVVSKAIYNTPGIYPSEVEAQANCGGETCNGVCLTTPEYDGLKAKLEKIKVDLS